MASLDGHGYGRVLTRLASFWGFVRKQRDAMPITRIVADHRETTYHYFLRSLQPPIDTVVKEASGLICIFHMIVNLQCLVLSRVLVLSDTFLKDTAQPGT